MTGFPARDDVDYQAGESGGTVMGAILQFFDVVRQMLGAAAETELTISSGSVTPTQAAHGIDTEADAATDDLTHLDQTNLPDGFLVMIRAVDAGRVPTVKHNAGGAGEILLVDSQDLVLNAIDKWLQLKRTGTAWEEVTRSYGSDLAAARAAIGAGTMNDLVNDTTPQQGGVLDSNGFAINESEGAEIVSGYTFSFATTDVDVGTNLITETGHKLAANVTGQFTTTGTLPAGLSLATDYHIISSGITADAFKVSASEGGAEIDITDQGTGTHTFTRNGGGMNIWDGDGNTKHVSGVIKIEDFTDAPRNGAWVKLVFDGILVITDGSGITLPGTANISTAAGDIAFVYADAVNAFRVAYFKADGTAVVGGGGGGGVTKVVFSEDTTARTTTSTSMVAAGPSVTITGVTSGKDVIVEFTGQVQLSVEDQYIRFEIRRGATSILSSGMEAHASTTTPLFSSPDAEHLMITGRCVDGGHGGGSVTYNLYWEVEAGTGHLGEPGGGSSTRNVGTTMVAMELA